jgi:hypothetical protein
MPIELAICTLILPVFSKAVSIASCSSSNLNAEVIIGLIDSGTSHYRATDGRHNLDGIGCVYLLMGARVAVGVWQRALRCPEPVQGAVADAVVVPMRPMRLRPQYPNDSRPHESVVCTHVRSDPERFQD